MQTFSGLDYMKIDVANCFGLDKETWDHRLTWFEVNKENLEELVADASEPYLMAKAVLAYREVQKGNPVSHTMFMDATNSGLQLMACLSGCYETAKRCNLVNTGNREDAYGYVADEMNKLLEPSERVTRADIKQPCMTHYYCKTSQESLSEAQEKVFYQVLSKLFSGAEDVKDVIQSCWNPRALEHKWTMPDGFEVVCKVKEMVDAHIEIDELNHSTFTYRFEANQPSKRSSSLCPNIIHSIDSYVVREMVRRSNNKGFLLAHIHDSFVASPKYMNIVRQLYREILAEIADSNLLADILSQILGYKVTLEKDTRDLSKYIRESEYALS